SAVLDIPMAPMASSTSLRNADYKMIISKEEESSNGEKCYSIYSVNQDDIRKLLDSLTQIVVLNVNNEFKDVSFPAVMPNKDVYSVKINGSKEKIFLGFTPWFGPLFTRDLSLKDFIYAL